MTGILELNRIARALLIVSASIGCVAEFDITEAACPCPSGYQCCSASNRCWPERSDCATVVLKSSRLPCARDDDCPATEICQGWTAVDNSLAGPQECRRSCSPTIPCADDETCLPTLHDSLPLHLNNLITACVPQVPPSDCENIQCQTCTPQMLEKTFCLDNHIAGCFLSIHQACGIRCQVVDLSPCRNEMCVSTENGASCLNSATIDACVLFPCSDCPAPLRPGEVGCVDGQLVACETFPAPSRSCQAVCVPTSLMPCSAGCSADNPPRCL